VQARHCGSYQLQYGAPKASALAYDIDLHWRINDRQVFAEAIRFEELWGSAVPVAELFEHAWAPKPVHALLVACIHRAHHMHVKYLVDGEAHFEANRLVWLYDIHALASGFTDLEWEEFIALAVGRRIGNVCDNGLRAAEEHLETHLDPSISERLLSRRERELSRRLLSGRGGESYRWNDFVALRSLRDKSRLVADWLWPTKEHMAQKFNVPVERVTPTLYLQRALIWGGKQMWNRLYRVFVNRRRD
jgi:hypothetical protein